MLFYLNIQARNLIAFGIVTLPSCLLSKNQNPYN